MRNLLNNLNIESVAVDLVNFFGSLSGGFERTDMVLNPVALDGSVFVSLLDVEESKLFHVIVLL